MKHILYWLGGFAVALGIFQYYETHRYSEDQLIYAQPPQNRSAVADFDALAYLNFLRSSANLPALAHSATLERAARNHARYLLQNPDDGHDEKNIRNPFYTGPRPSDRTRKAGYAYKGVHENVSTGQHPPNEKINDHLPAQHQLDNLMTAIYHRLSLLDQNIDEAGASFESQGKQIALSINQGDSRFNSLCQKNRPLSDLSRSFYQDACHGHAIVYADEISNRKTQPYITYPQGNFASPVFHGERPDPMPHYEMTGNPISIAFSEQSPPVKMRSFKLYRDTKEISDVKILDKDNDPNRLLTERQFALFPLQPLEYDTDYRAVFEYRQNGKNRTAEWTFSTQKPDYPYFIVKGGETLAIESGQKYFIHWQDFWCLKQCERYNYRMNRDTQIDIIERQAGGIIIRVNGSKGSSIRLMPEGEDRRAITLYLWK